MARNSLPIFLHFYLYDRAPSRSSPGKGLYQMTAFCTTACKKRKACRTPHHAGSAGLLSGGQTSPDYNSTVAAPREPNNQGYSVLLAGIFEAGRMHPLKLAHRQSRKDGMALSWRMHSFGMPG